MPDLHHFIPNWDFEYILVISVCILGIYLILLIIPGVGTVVKHITHTLTKYIIFPVINFFVKEVCLMIFRFIWAFVKYVLKALKVYWYNLTQTHEKIYPKLAKKKIGVIDD